jgi:hypothetical protein
VSTAAILVAVRAPAAALPPYLLDTVPPGLYLDETLVAQRALTWRLAAHKEWFGGTPLIVAGWVQISNLYLEAVSAVLWLFGDAAAAPSTSTATCPGIRGRRRSRFYAIDGRENLADDLGRTLATILRVRPRSAGAPEPSGMRRTGAAGELARATADGPHHRALRIAREAALERSGQRVSEPDQRVRRP